MTVKDRMVEHLGEASILTPGLVQEGLRANDRAKVRMSALQAALRHAQYPGDPCPDLSSEAGAAGLDAMELDRFVRAARALSEGQASAPGVGQLVDHLFDDVSAMNVAVETASDATAPAFRERLAALRSATKIGSDAISSSGIAAITSASAGGEDSVHRLVMDLHKALNRLAIAFADEIVAGAHAHGLRPEDRRPVEAFMRGVESTRMLKFDHPGLDTTAARSGDRLVIQNDIGTTDAHVLLVAIQGDGVTVTYTDLHRGRAKFFVAMFERFEATWSDLASDRASQINNRDAFYLVTGKLTNADEGAREAFLEAVGAALVFLIDWNKARKTLRQFIDKGEIAGLLSWAARHRHGHRAFLQLGGGDLVTGAIRRVAATRLDYGVRLDEALGKRGASEFLRAVLRLCADALLHGRAGRQLHDAIDAELARRLQSTESELLHGVIRQAGLARAIAAGLGESIEDLRLGRASDRAGLAARAKYIEEKADRIAVALRADARRYKAREFASIVIDSTEQAIDELEEAAFLLSLLPASTQTRYFEPLRDLARATVRGAENVARAADAAALVGDGVQTDTDDALEAIAALAEIEHEADESERNTLVVVMGASEPGAGSLGVMECARKMESATDHFARAAHGLRALVMGDLTA